MQNNLSNKILFRKYYQCKNWEKEDLYYDLGERFRQSEIKINYIEKFIEIFGNEEFFNWQQFCLFVPLSLDLSIKFKNKVNWTSYFSNILNNEFLNKKLSNEFLIDVINIETNRIEKTSNKETIVDTIETNIERIQKEYSNFYSTIFRIICLEEDVIKYMMDNLYSNKNYYGEYSYFSVYEYLFSCQRLSIEIIKKYLIDDKNICESYLKDLFNNFKISSIDKGKLIELLSEKDKKKYKKIIRRYLISR